MRTGLYVPVVNPDNSLIIKNVLFYGTLFYLNPVLLILNTERVICRECYTIKLVSYIAVC